LTLDSHSQLLDDLTSEIQCRTFIESTESDYEHKKYSFDIPVASEEESALHDGEKQEKNIPTFCGVPPLH
jgi:hypothetical protein